MHKSDFNILVVLVAVIMLLAGVSAYAYTTQANIVDAVKKGILKLECDMKDGTRIIDHTLIKYYLDDTWVFTNGHAKSCRVLP